MSKSVNKIRNEQLAFANGYSVTSKGLVIDKDGNPVKVTINDQGYQIFGFGSRVNKTVKHISVHRLQAYMKFGNNMYLFQCVRHLDGDKLNNSIENIMVGSYVDNYHDVKKIDRRDIILKMSKTKSKITKSDYNEILEMKKEGLCQKDIAKKFDISPSYLSQILNLKRKSHFKN